MKQKIWAKTLLSAYNCLENIADAIDSLVMSQGIHSGNNNNTAFQNAEKIITLIGRKKLLINLKVLTEKVMENLTVDEARILILKYFDRVKTENIAEVLQISRRTYFRKISLAEEEFAKELSRRGFTFSQLEEMTKKESWITQLFTSISEQDAKLRPKPDIDGKEEKNVFYSPQISMIKAKSTI